MNLNVCHSLTKKSLEIVYREGTMEAKLIFPPTSMYIKSAFIYREEKAVD